jgi:GNAT superfamily N-acetyltransferase
VDDSDTVRLRPATDADEEFLRWLHREAMGPHVEAAWGSWDDDVQRQRFGKAPIADHTIVLECDQPIGCLLVILEPDAIVLSRIWITPAAQGRGIGSRLIARVCQQADTAGVPVRLRVLRANRASRLYARLGFRVVKEHPTHVVMERPFLDE